MKSADKMRMTSKLLGVVNALANRLAVMEQRVEALEKGEPKPTEWNPPPEIDGA